MSAYKWKVCGYLRVAPALTASSEICFWAPFRPQFNSFANSLCMQATVVCLWWLVGSLVCFVVGGCFIHLSYGELMESEAIILGSYLTRVLHTARISNVDVALSGVKEWKLGNFKLNWNINVKTNLSACHQRGTKKKSESPRGFKPMTSKTLGGRSIHLSYGVLECPSGVWEVIGSNPVSHSDFFFGPRWWHAD